ncbi:MAG: TauD/TfdA family dioxygenase [Sneathiellaceae bacterium]
MEPAFAARPLSPDLGCEIRGLDVGTLSGSSHLPQVKALLNRHHMLVFKEQRMDAARMIAFTEHFGELDTHILRQFTHKDHATVSIISNIEDRKPNVNDVSLNWHTDLAYRKRPSAFVTLYAEVVPEVGADTRFASMQRVYRDMPEAEKDRLRGRRATYSFVHLHSKRPDPDPLTPEQLLESADVHHPILRRHPDTGEEILYINLPDCIGISGMAQDEALAVVRDLYERITDPKNTIAHKWEVGDLVIWDNRTLMHSATYFDAAKYRRRMLRTVVRGEEPMPSAMS